ncbi:abortive infection family protein [Martelella lutilitoris]|uniref:Abortive infection family protein n=1 Tax=Martelella lutilitoris TaxID=2583532 RepID=A0A7T7HNB3_9HYPH|nr:abortive infection family protein [Martelella lutilitoris]QQM32364.1 abortive infection family protein [Martelella lutilitoris]
MSYIDEQFETYLSTAAELLAAEGMSEAVDVLRRAVPKVDQTGYDNWNGGTDIWTIFLRIEPARYAQLGTNREALEEQVSQRIESIVRQYTDDWFSVKIVPEARPRPDWRQQSDDISRLAKQNILDGLKIENVKWSGCLEEVEFLQRLYDLKSMASYDSRFPDAAGDIWQHRVNNPEDWDDDWIYNDERFNLLKGPTDQFLRFLCEIVHPVVRPDRNEALKLVQQFNDQLRPVGWQLVEVEKIAGRPRFVAQRVENAGGRSISRARNVADALDAGWMQKEIERLENAVDRDPALAIGTAKDLVETCCKSILAKRGVKISRSASLPELTKALSKELKLVPEGIPDEAKGAEKVRLILQNLSALTKYLAELRGLYGTGHGRDGKHRGLEPRHARLAVGAAVTFIDFATETYRERYPEKNSGQK